MTGGARTGNTFVGKAILIQSLVCMQNNTMQYDPEQD